MKRYSIHQNTHLAANGRCATHNDAYMSDTYRIDGPLGKSPQIVLVLCG